VQDLDAHHCVFVKESTRVDAIRTDATDARGQMNHDVRSLRCEQPLHRLAVDEVAFGRARNEDVFRAALAKLFHYETAEETCPAGH
jgi:hypothetical protein